MPRFLIEAHHAPDDQSCKNVVRMFLDTGSHYLANAEWGCADGVHKAWMIVEADDREEAKMIVPPFLRQDVEIIQLNRFFTDEMGAILSSHGGDG